LSVLALNTAKGFEMKKYSWQAVYLSFFSRDLYGDVAINWKGVGYLYLLLLIVVTTAIAAIVCQITWGALISQTVDPTINKVPKMTFDKGKLSIDKPSPYMFDLGPGTIVDFDMSDNAKFPDGKKGFLITSTNVQSFTESAAENQPLNFSSIPDQGAPTVIDQSTIQFGIGILKSSIGIGVFVVRGTMLMMLCIVQSLVYALIGLAVASAMKIDLSYGQLVRLTSIALTPGLIIDSINFCANSVIPAWGFISIFVAIAYLIFAVQANKQPQAATPLA
jgi:hypothetical protein